MSDFPQQPEHRDFHCNHCNGRIVIPFSLPSATGPCPHCGETIVSPPPPEQSPAPEQALDAPQKPVHLPASTRTETPANPVKTVAPVTTPATAPVMAATKEKSSKGKMIAVLVILLLLLGGGAAFYFLTQNNTDDLAPPSFTIPTNVKPVTPANQYAGWDKEAKEVLEKFLAGTSAEEKLPYIYDADRLGTEVTEFYGDVLINDSDTPASDFQVRALPETDMSRGIFMLTYNQPLKTPLQNFGTSQDNNEDTTQQPVIVHAFFKRTEDGLKVDWNVFAQTKYRLLQNFVENSEIDDSSIFRVLLTTDAAAEGEAATRTYRIVDPMNMQESVEVEVKADSTVGRALSELQSTDESSKEPTARTATVELGWTDASGEPKLEIKRLVSWEFLGLGGTEIPVETTAE